MTSEEVETARLTYDERRLRIEEERLAIEKLRVKRESKFVRANIGIIITGVISVLAILSGVL